jgi:hypothetical protein
MNNAAVRLKEPSFDEERCKFMRDEVFMLTVMAVVQRGQVYSETCTETEKSDFRHRLREHLEGIIDKYKEPTAEEVHLQNIESLANQLSHSCGNLLYHSRFRIGSAQKALNLFLKYLWCMGEVARPPHCPFDRRVIVGLLKDTQCNWTQCDHIDCYNRWVTEAKVKAGAQSLAEWEVAAYNES